YFPDTGEVEIVSPLPVHESIVMWLLGQFNEYVKQTGHDTNVVNVKFPENSRLHDKEYAQQFLDMMRVITTYDKCSTHAGLVRWIAETGFSQTDASMKKKLKLVTDKNSDITLAIIISIDEDGKFNSPDERNDTAKKYRNNGLMDLKTF
ncbi:hypothetical protein DFH29DRAFT_777993, partial [Suillus ampliporus]